MQYNFYTTPNGLLKPLSRKEHSIPFDILNIVSDTTGYNLGLWTLGEYDLVFGVNFTTAAPKDMYLNFQYLTYAPIFSFHGFNESTGRYEIPIKASYSDICSLIVNDTNYTYLNTYLYGNSRTEGVSAGRQLISPACATDPTWCDMSGLIVGAEPVNSQLPHVDLTTGTSSEDEIAYSIFIPKGETAVWLRLRKPLQTPMVMSTFTLMFSVSEIGTPLALIGSNYDLKNFIFVGSLESPQ